MVEEANASRDVDLLLVPRAGLAVQVNGYRDLGLVCLALNRRCPSRHFRSSYLPVSDGGWESKSL